ncbi:MAG TPA: hypothetical protein EYP02_01550 [Sulfurovum sp.]|nr:hypothetical protein [Sulfurovum sp.]
MYIKNETIISLGFASLFLGALLGSSFYIGVIILTPVRLGIITASLILFFHFNSMNRDYKVQPILLFIFLFYTYQFIVGNYVAVMSATVDSTTKVANSIFLYALLTLLFLYGNIYKRYIAILYKVSKYFMFILVIVSLIEITFKIHFSFSIVNTMPEIFHYTPSAFYTNQNDFLAIVSLLLIFNMLVLKYYKKDNRADMLIFVSYLLYAIFLSVITSSRVNMIVLLLIFLIFLLEYKKTLLTLFISFIMILVLFPSFVEMYNLYIDSISFGKGESTSMRFHLYKDALLNFKIFGEGTDNSSLLYIALENPEYQGMTNPHNYILELLINNGYLFLITYLAFNGYLIFKSILMSRYFLALTFMLYPFILISSSSSLFIWSQYIYYIGFIVLFIDLLNENFKKEGVV